MWIDAVGLAEMNSADRIKTGECRDDAIQDPMQLVEIDRHGNAAADGFRV
jgi:hypothetical protein